MANAMMKRQSEPDLLFAKQQICRILGDLTAMATTTTPTLPASDVSVLRQAAARHPPP
jgi:hypothetical protein